MPNDIYLRYLQQIGVSYKDVTVVQIGAADGRSFDPLHGAITEFKWRGLLVEPLPDLYAALRETYRDHPQLRFENVAVDDFECDRTLFRVPLQVVKDGRVPDWALRISSFYSDRNAIGGIRASEADFERLKDYIILEKVRCLPL